MIEEYKLITVMLWKQKEVNYKAVIVGIDECYPRVPQSKPCDFSVEL